MKERGCWDWACVIIK